MNDQKIASRDEKTWLTRVNQARNDRDWKALNALVLEGQPPSAPAALLDVPCEFDPYYCRTHGRQRVSVLTKACLALATPAPKEGRPMSDDRLAALVAAQGGLLPYLHDLRGCPSPGGPCTCGRDEAVDAVIAATRALTPSDPAAPLREWIEELRAMPKEAWAECRVCGDDGRPHRMAANLAALTPAPKEADRA